MALIGVPPPSRLRGLPESTQRQFDYFYEWILRLFGFLAGIGKTVTVEINTDTDNLSTDDFDEVQFIRLNVTTTANLTGVQAPRGVITRKTLRNVGSANLTLTNQDSGSGSANQFLLPGSLSVTLLPRDTIDIWYDSISIGWAPI